MTPQYISDVRRVLDEGGLFVCAARKVGGDYQATGMIVGACVKASGDVRLVFEFDTIPGMLHIFRPDQLEALP